MSNNFNKKKFILIPSAKKIQYIIITLTLILFLFLIYDELYLKKRYQELLKGIKKIDLPKCALIIFDIANFSALLIGLVS